MSGAGESALTDVAVVGFDGRMVMAMDTEMVQTGETFFAHFAHEGLDAGMDDEMAFEVGETGKHLRAFVALEAGFGIAGRPDIGIR